MISDALLAVAHQAAAKQAQHYGLRAQEREDLVQVALHSICRIEDKRGPQTPGYHRNAANNAIHDYIATLPLVRVPRKTASGMIKRGETPPKFKFFRPQAGEDGFDPFVSRPLGHAWNEILDLYEYLYGLTNNDDERTILEATWDDGRCIYEGPIDRELIVFQTGFPLGIVNATLDNLQRRYHKETGKNPWCDFDTFCRVRQVPRALRSRIASLAPEVKNWGRFLKAPRTWDNVPQEQVPLYFLALVRSDHAAALDLLVEITPRLVRAHRPFGYAKTAIANLHKCVA
ncbi:hypothetical protein [Botrimarina mediterranea]|uniref:Uncharacterized protein n=1 Tax=Botrimarina mediterranea TaxID=2528022 RepID=A0A518K3V4_9BACT|nr:hypothetical protein [Botrimarina mediterranea]QDV72471.1 hypothetical protein Spa11_06490 [Botrimarina mediterranea]QDV77041.1 hypothetical protein K2D_06280 [Planctomycetes bacterium K2D]